MDTTDRLSASRIDTLNLCPRKYFYAYEQHLQGVGGKKTELEFGIAVHKALESLYKGTGFTDTKCPLCEDGCLHCKGRPIPHMLAAFLEKYPRDPEDPKDPRTRNNGIDLLVGYLSKWRRESFKILAVEQPFVLEFDGFNYRGRIDLIVEWGPIMPMDHKSTSRYGMFFDTGFKLSIALGGYMRATSLVIGQFVSQACINGLRITSRIDIDESYCRLFTSRTPEDMDEWEREVRGAIVRIRSYRDSGHWPKAAPYACTAYNRICEFYPLCTAGAAQREELIQSAFIPRPDDPMGMYED